MGDRNLWVVEEDDPDILYRDRPYRRLTIIRRLPHLQLLETQGEVGRIADMDRSPHHGSWGVSEQRDPSEKINTYLADTLLLVSLQALHTMKFRNAPHSILIICYTRLQVIPEYIV